MFPAEHNLMVGENARTIVDKLAWRKDSAFATVKLSRLTVICSIAHYKTALRALVANHFADPQNARYQFHI